MQTKELKLKQIPEKFDEKPSDKSNENETHRSDQIDSPTLQDKVISTKNKNFLYEKLEQAFNTYDQEKLGYLTKDQLREFLNEIRQSLYLNQIDDKIFDKIFDIVDIDGNGQIEYEEFTDNIPDILPILAQDGDLLNNTKNKIFKDFDQDKKGYLSFEEFRLQIHLSNDRKSLPRLSDMNINYLIKLIDEDRDGVLSYEEFEMNYHIVGREITRLQIEDNFFGKERLKQRKKTLFYDEAFQIRIPRKVEELDMENMKFMETLGELCSKFQKKYLLLKKQQDDQYNTNSNLEIINIQSQEHAKKWVPFGKLVRTDSLGGALNNYVDECPQRANDQKTEEYNILDSRKRSSFGDLEDISEEESRIKLGSEGSPQTFHKERKNSMFQKEAFKEINTKSNKRRNSLGQGEITLQRHSVRTDSTGIEELTGCSEKQQKQFISGRKSSFAKTGDIAPLKSSQQISNNDLLTDTEKIDKKINAEVHSSEKTRFRNSTQHAFMQNPISEHVVIKAHKKEVTETIYKNYLGKHSINSKNSARNSDSLSKNQASFARQKSEILQSKMQLKSPFKSSFMSPLIDNPESQQNFDLERFVIPKITTFDNETSGSQDMNTKLTDSAYKDPIQMLKKSKRKHTYSYQQKFCNAYDSFTSNVLERYFMSKNQANFFDKKTHQEIESYIKIALSYKSDQDKIATRIFALIKGLKTNIDNQIRNCDKNQVKYRKKISAKKSIDEKDAVMQPIHDKTDNTSLDNHIVTNISSKMDWINLTHEIGMAIDLNENSLNRIPVEKLPTKNNYFGHPIISHNTNKSMHINVRTYLFSFIKRIGGSNKS